MHSFSVLTLEQYGFELYGSTCMWIVFFNKFLYCFLAMVESPWMWRANRVHWSLPFYLRDLSIHRFWYLQGVLEPVPLILLRDSLSFGKLKSYTQIFDCVEVIAPNHNVFKGQLYNIVFSFCFCETIMLHWGPCLHPFLFTFGETFVPSRTPPTSFSLGNEALPRLQSLILCWFQGSFFPAYK